LGLIIAFDDRNLAARAREPCCERWSGLAGADD